MFQKLFCADSGNFMEIHVSYEEVVIPLFRKCEIPFLVIFKVRVGIYLLWKIIREGILSYTKKFLDLNF